MKEFKIKEIKGNVTKNKSGFFVTATNETGDTFAWLTSNALVYDIDSENEGRRLYAEKHISLMMACEDLWRYKMSIQFYLNAFDITVKGRTYRIDADFAKGAFTGIDEMEDWAEQAIMGALWDGDKERYISANNFDDILQGVTMYLSKDLW